MSTRQIHDKHVPNPKVSNARPPQKAQMINLKNLAPTVLIVACTEAFSSLPPHVPVHCRASAWKQGEDLGRVLGRSPGKTILQ